MTDQSEREKIILIETTQQRIDCFEDNNEIIDHLMTLAEKLEDSEFKNEVYWLQEACENLEGLMCIITGQD